MRVAIFGFHALGVSHHVGRDITLIKTHALYGLYGHAKTLGFFHGNDAVLAHFLHGRGNFLANVFVVGGNGSHIGNLIVSHRFRNIFLKLFNNGLHALIKAALEGDRVNTGRNILHAFAHNGLGQNRGRSRAIAHIIVGFAGHFLHQFHAGIFKLIFHFNFFSDRDAVLGNSRRAKALIQNHITAPGAQSDFNGIGQNIHAA